MTETIEDVELPIVCRDIGRIAGPSRGAVKRIGDGSGVLRLRGGVLQPGLPTGQWPPPALSHLTLASLLVDHLRGRPGEDGTGVRDVTRASPTEHERSEAPTEPVGDSEPTVREVVRAAREARFPGDAGSARQTSAASASRHGDAQHGARPLSSERSDLSRLLERTHERLRLLPRQHERTYDRGATPGEPESTGPDSIDAESTTTASIDTELTNVDSIDTKLTTTDSIDTELTTTDSMAADPVDASVGGTTPDLESESGESAVVGRPAESAAETLPPVGGGDTDDRDSQPETRATRGTPASGGWFALWSGLPRTVLRETGGSPTALRRTDRSVTRLFVPDEGEHGDALSAIGTDRDAGSPVGSKLRSVDGALGSVGTEPVALTVADGASTNAGTTSPPSADVSPPPAAPREGLAVRRPDGSDQASVGPSAEDAGPRMAVRRNGVSSGGSRAGVEEAGVSTLIGASQVDTGSHTDGTAERNSSGSASESAAELIAGQSSEAPPGDAGGRTGDSNALALEETLDVPRLADRLYRELERKHRIERERRGRR